MALGKSFVSSFPGHITSVLNFGFYECIMDLFAPRKEMDVTAINRLSSIPFFQRTKHFSLPGISHWIRTKFSSKDFDSNSSELLLAFPPENCPTSLESTFLFHFPEPHNYIYFPWKVTFLVTFLLRVLSFPLEHSSLRCL